ncbi:thioesterase family protein [Anaerolineales bacterium]
MAQSIVETRFHVRYAETDAMGIVHHASYIVYFEEGRSAFIRAQGSSYAKFEESGYFLAVTALDVKYLRSAKYDQELIVRCWVVKARSRTLTFAYEILNAISHEILVTGTSEHICITREGIIATIPAQWREWVSPNP